MCRTPLVVIFALVASVVAPAVPVGAASCPTSVLFESTGYGTTDAGPSGYLHDLPLSGPTLFLGIDCGPSEPPCGVCTIAGVVPDPVLQPQRCAYDHSIACTVATEVADCGGPGRCRTYLGPPEMIAGGGIGFCIMQSLGTYVGGSVDVETGDFAPRIPLRVQFSEFGVRCARCVGDAVLNDGLKNGTCDAGPQEGLPCDAHATSTFSDFGSTSFDCSEPLWTELDVGPITASTGTTTQTLTSASPNCGAAAPGQKCWCQTCNTLAAEPCFTSADCPPSGGNPGVCGGSRCVGGSNAGAPCAAVSVCPGGSCNRVGEPTKPDACEDDSTTPFDCVDVGGGEGECSEGPFSTYCVNHPNRSCETDSHCDGVPGACQTRPHPCFPDNGMLGASLTVSGGATPPVADVSDPTDLATLGCIGSSDSAIVNFVGGYPGLVRSVQPGRLTFSDAIAATPGPTPTAPPSATPTTSATPTPVPGPCASSPGVCRVPGYATLQLDDRSPDDKDQLRWSWSKGAATTLADFGDPLTSDTYFLCVYDDTGLRATFEIPPGGLCDGKPCWQQRSSGFRYRSKAGSPHGITQLTLKTGVDGKAQIQARGRGALLPLPSLPSLTGSLDVQIRNGTSALCWGAMFVPPFDKDLAVRIKDRAD